MKHLLLACLLSLSVACPTSHLIAEGSLVPAEGYLKTAEGYLKTADGYLKTAEGSSVPAEGSFKVVELFTSQGCSSCPPADKFLNELADDDKLITIACHVTYWDYLGWKDSFSQDYCDRRQSYYQKKLKIHSRYTPQMVINGKGEGIGSQKRFINRIINQQDTNPPVKIIMSQQGNALLLDISRLTVRDNLKIDLIGLAPTEKVTIKKGENKGRVLTYRNAASVVYPLTLHDIKNNVISFTPPNSQQVNSWVALANDYKTGRVYAAGKIEL